MGWSYTCISSLCLHTHVMGWPLPFTCEITYRHCHSVIYFDHDRYRPWVFVSLCSGTCLIHPSVSVSIFFLSWIPQSCLGHQLPSGIGSFVIHIFISLHILQTLVIHQFSVEQVLSYAHAGLLHQLQYYHTKLCYDCNVLYVKFGTEKNVDWIFIIWCWPGRDFVNTWLWTKILVISQLNTQIIVLW